MRKRFGEERFVGLQRAAGAPRGRIEIVRQRNRCQLLYQGFDHRHLAVASDVLGRNCWIVARLFTDQKSSKPLDCGDGMKPERTRRFGARYLLRDDLLRIFNKTDLLPASLYYPADAFLRKG